MIKEDQEVTESKSEKVNMTRYFKNWEKQEKCKTMFELGNDKSIRTP